MADGEALKSTQEHFKSTFWTILLHPPKMASKRAVSKLQPAVNASLPRALRLAGAQKLSYTTQSIAGPSPAFRVTSRPLQQQRQQFARYASTEAAEKPARTGLYELHSKYGAKFVPFGGYEMPVQYGDLSIIESHHWTREKASLFDVGHM
jgi:aminomethyltransferase